MSEAPLLPPHVDPVIRALELADRGLAECRGCGHILPLCDVLTTGWHATLVFETCMDCFSNGRVVLARRTEQGAEGRFAHTKPTVVTGDSARLTTLPIAPHVVRKIIGGQ